MISSVVDIGSNSIKLLVARGGNAEPVFEALSETRLSPDAESARERISDEAFAAGVNAVRALAEQARAFSPAREAVVGTSLFRTAENARAFADAVFRATGTPMRILSGREEAELVAAGAATDPAVRTPCAIFDLGGGSLEFVAKTDAAPRSGDAAESWALGAVRASRRFFSDASGKIPTEEISALRAFARATVAPRLPREVPRGAQFVFCGGAAGICARFAAEKNGGNGGEIPAEIFEELLREMSGKTTAERVARGVPAKRADIFPAALAVFAEVCAVCGVRSFLYTRRNLRYGLCAALCRGDAAAFGF